MPEKILKRLLTISQEMAANRELDSLLSYTMNQMLELFQAEFGYLILLDEWEQLDFRVKQDKHGHEIDEPETQVSHTILDQVIGNLKPLLIADAVLNPTFQKYQSVRLLQIRSVMCVPLLAHGTVLGALYIENRTASHAFSQADLENLTMFAAQTAVAIENALLNNKLKAQIDKRTQGLETLYQVTAVATQYNHLDTILQKSLDMIVKTLHLHGGIIILLPSEEQNNSLLIHTGLRSETIDLISQPNFAKALVTYGVQQETLHIKDITQATELPLPPDLVEEWDKWEVLVLPFYLFGKPVGVLGIVNRLDHLFDDQDVALLTSAAKQIGLSIENNQLYRQNEQLVVISEREQLARDVHDSISQQLFGLKLLSENLKKKAEKNELAGVTDLATKMQSVVRQTNKEMHLLLSNLRANKPLEDGLVLALEKRLALLETYTNTEVDYVVEGDFNLPAECQIHLFLIAQEAVSNALKHAQASKFKVQLTRNETGIYLMVQDNGIGFDPQQRHTGMGLMNMNERALRLGGQLQIDSVPEQGTTISVAVRHEHC